MVGLRAAEAGLALLGLLRHRSRRLAGESPGFLGRPANSCGQGPQPSRQHQARDQGEGLSGSGHGQPRLRIARGFGWRRHWLVGFSEARWQNRNVDDHDRYVTGSDVGALSDGRALGAERHSDRTHRKKNRCSPIGIGHDVDRSDRGDTIGHLEHRDDSMTGERISTFVQIRRC